MSSQPTEFLCNAVTQACQQVHTSEACSAYAVHMSPSDVPVQAIAFADSSTEMSPFCGASTLEL